MDSNQSEGEKLTFESLFSQTQGKVGSFKEGDVVDGTVLRIEKDNVLVDIGFKSEGWVPIEEFYNLSNEVNVKIGDQISVFIEEVEDKAGKIILSKEKADKMRIWDRIEAWYEKDELVEGKIIDKVKGGLAVDIGVKAFLPGSQIDLVPIRNLDTFMGKTFKFKLIKFNKRRGNIVLSRRVLLEKEREYLKKETLERLSENETVEGVVKNITEYGMFVDLGGIDGLLHITDMSWGRLNHPSELFRVGEKIKVKVLKYEKESERVSLGYKQIQPDPWAKVPERYPVGSALKGKVVNVTDYGAFIEIEPGIEGLIHVTEMSWTKKVKHPSKIVAIGDEVDAVVLEIDREQKRISLGLKQLQPNPWEEVAHKYPVGSKVKGKVRNITDFGVFVGIENGIDGLIHISDMSWTQKIKHPSEVLKKGDAVEAIVIQTDVENERFALSIKHMTQDPWKNLTDKYPIGTRITGTISKVADFGIFVRLENEIEGLIHMSEVDDDKKQNIKEAFKEGDKIDAMVISSDTKERKLGLSLSALSESDERASYQSYVAESEKQKTSLGDLLKEATILKNKNSGDNNT